MPERRTPSLTEILEAFNKEASLDPTVAEAAPVVEQAPVIAPTTPADPIVTAAKQVVDAASSVNMDKDSLERAAKNMQEDTTKLDSAAAALKTIAKTAAENHEDTMFKEASVFGEIFASAVIDKIEEHNLAKTAHENGYNATLQKFASEIQEEDLTKIAEEAYAACIAKIAFDEGYGAVQAMPQEAQVPGGVPVPQTPADPNSPLIPQPEAAVVPQEEVVEVPEAAAQEGTLSEATEAVQTAAQAARAAAEAAKAAVKAAVGDNGTPEIVEEAVAEGEPLEEEVAEQLPKVAHEAYCATVEYLQKTASTEMSDEELASLLTKVAQEAYDIVVNGN